MKIGKSKEKTNKFLTANALKNDRQGICSWNVGQKYRDGGRLIIWLRFISFHAIAKLSSGAPKAGPVGHTSILVF